MIWEESRWNREILELVRRMARLRREHPELRTAPYRRLYAVDGHLAFTRGPYLVVVNASSEPFRQDFPVHGALPRGAQAVDLLSGQTCTPTGGRLCGPELPPFSLAIWIEI